MPVNANHRRPMFANAGRCGAMGTNAGSGGWEPRPDEQEKEATGSACEQNLCLRGPWTPWSNQIMVARAAGAEVEV